MEPRKRSTMNSRDAMYEEEVKAALEASRMEMTVRESEEADADRPVEEEVLPETRINKGKRKRDDDDVGEWMDETPESERDLLIEFQTLWSPFKLSLHPHPKPNIRTNTPTALNLYLLVSPRHLRPHGGANKAVPLCRLRNRLSTSMVHDVRALSPTAR
jgi:hypothetical protein